MHCHLDGLRFGNSAERKHSHARGVGLGRIRPGGGEVADLGSSNGLGRRPPPEQLSGRRAEVLALSSQCEKANYRTGSESPRHLDDPGSDAVLDPRRAEAGGKDPPHGLGALSVLAPVTGTDTDILLVSAPLPRLARRSPR